MRLGRWVKGSLRRTNRGWLPCQGPWWVCCWLATGELLPGPGAPLVPSGTLGGPRRPGLGLRSRESRCLPRSSPLGLTGGFSSVSCPKKRQEAKYNGFLIQADKSFMKTELKSTYFKVESKSSIFWEFSSLYSWLGKKWCSTHHWAFFDSSLKSIKKDCSATFQTRKVLDSLLKQKRSTDFNRNEMCWIAAFKKVMNDWW